ncbi:hypothetical protein [Archaeoglobus profundus]|uniref:Uncharacterized protein n=1 Tax=Archaeoglobus profundus (strain DSM 5631 / JCM 9629 / NBRC 100127 / Av18) TaxID=572546 RepID=D2RFA9_ARCPA|nr:hypothetical protein [Archaeoglobus profundus]ADB58803.1 hypothetical protein Arcpr_1759 [Archaeoglobus profundus DSM 5631]
MPQRELYITTDPYTFTSAEGLESLKRALRAISEICNCKVRVVIPTLLYRELEVLKEGEIEKSILLRPFLIPRRIGIVRMIQLIPVLRQFFYEFKPESAHKYIEEVKEVGPVTRRYIEVELLRVRRELLGYPEMRLPIGWLSSLIFDYLALTHRLGALIVSFRRRFVDILQKLKIAVLVAHSRFKTAVKERARIVRRDLIIIGTALTRDALERLINQFNFDNLPITIAEYLAGKVLIIVADG